MPLSALSQTIAQDFRWQILICTLLLPFTYILWSKWTSASILQPDKAVANAVEPSDRATRDKEDIVLATETPGSLDRNKDAADAVALQERRQSDHDSARVPIVEAPKQKLAHADYTIGWICALSTEYVAAQVFLDERHEGPEYVPSNDNNDYTLGKVGSHNVVIAVLPNGEYGISSATGVAKDMLHSFPNIRIGLMVGIAGGAPSQKHDIRLGDVVVSAPRDGTGGVFQYDFGKAIQGGIFHTKSFLNKPPILLRTAVNGLKADYEINGHRIEEAISDILERKPRLRRKYERPQPITDKLYKSTIAHPQDTEGSCVNFCGSDMSRLILRPERTQDEDNPSIHYGLIASANQVMKDALTRDKLIKEKDVLCFEMEAAGLMNQFPCLVIRGICDYADSHKNEEWQGYAAMTAAAYTRDLLHRIPLQQVRAEKRISDVLSSVQKGVDKLLYFQQNKDYQEILDWLTPIDYAPQQKDYIQIRQPETGQWFLDSGEYQTWIESDKQTLFCPGVPGAGKTIMTAVVIDNLYARYKDDAKIGIAYLYCDYRKQYEQKAEDLLANLLKQLTQGQAVIPGCIQTLYSNYKNKPKRPPLHELSEALRSISILYSKVFIIVDALDECRTADGCRKSFLSELFNLQAETNTNIFATARFIQEIEEAFKQTSSLNITAKDEDVQKYVTANMSRLPSFVLRNPEVQSEIKTAMSKSADGMFLLVRLHTDSLAQLPTVGDVKQALQNLPRSLDETYKQAMARIESQSEAFQKLAKKILSWLTWAKTVLFVAELQHAVAVKLGTAELDEEFIPDKEIMGSVCAGLVTIDNESGAIRLAHYTTQQYFRRVGGRWFQDAEANIARLCLTYISFREFESGYCNTDDEFQQRIQLYPLYEYAANHWGFHSRAAPEMQPLILDFLGCEAKVSASGQAIRSGRMAAIHLAAIFGLESIVAYFFDNGYDIDARDANGRTPLWWASEMGQRNVVNLLIDYGAEINSTDYTKHETPLFKALELGREDIIRLLLENGADANLIANGLTALSYPIEEKDQGTVTLLLENGANVNLMDNGGYPPLVYAIRKKDNGIIRLLLENGADINLMNTKGYPALFYAITQKDQGIIRLLLENGADVNVFDNKGRPMLLHAITQKDQGIVRLLQENGADVNISYNGFPALVWAIIGGDEGIVRVLLEIGADVNLIDASGYSALTHAIMYQDEGIARLLLENGADVNCLIQGDTPLSIALMMRKESMGNLLLEYGGKTWIGY